MHCTRKQTSPPQILEANHKYTVPVKGPPQMRKNLWHCISERNPLQRNFRSHMAEAHARKCSGDSSQCRNSDEQIGRTCSNTSTPSLSIFAEQSVRELNTGRVTCLVPRSHRNAGLQPLLHAHVIREDDAPERQSLQLLLHAWRDPMICSSREHESCALARSADKRREVGKGLSLADTQTGR